MKKILVIGNSHVGAIKKGIESISSNKNFNFSYVALPGERFSNLSLSGRNIIFPECELPFLREVFGISESLSLDDFDLFLYVAESSRLHFGLYSRDGRIPALSDKIIYNIVRYSFSPFFGSIQSAVKPAKLIFLGGPLRFPSYPRYRKHKKSLIETPYDSARLLELTSAVRKICGDTIMDKSFPSLVLPPPHLLVSSQLSTREEYLVGGTKVNGKNRNQLDTSHANASYGKEIGQFIINFIESSPENFE